MDSLKNFPGARGSYHFLWAWAAHRFHGAPSRKIFVIGVTGTKGKTTTLELLNAMLEAAGKRTALLSSLRVKVGERTEKNPTTNSMPGRSRIQRFLRDAVHAKCGYALIEVTSQGVVQHRHRFINWNIGIITNLHPEHIESHGSFEKYRAAKLGFLQYVVKKGGKVFLNRDDENFPFFAHALEARGGGGKAGSPRVIAYAREDARLDEYLPKDTPLSASLGGGAARGARGGVNGGARPKFLLSDFNERNIATAAAVARELGVSDKTIAGALAHFNGVPGRMEFVTAGPYTAIADYAHTPDSLEAAYRAAKPAPSPHYPEPKLICVLGAAGGGRDRWKRKAFGEIAAAYCDEIVLTDEDPYDEDPREIVREVRSGILGGDPDLANVYEVMDRREAIRKAVALARPGDVVIGTGKGSEDWIHVAWGGKIPWNERAEFEAALRAKNGRADPDVNVDTDADAGATTDASDGMDSGARVPPPGV